MGVSGFALIRSAHPCGSAFIASQSLAYYLISLNGHSDGVRLIPPKASCLITAPNVSNGSFSGPPRSCSSSLRRFGAACGFAASAPTAKCSEQASAASAPTISAPTPPANSAPSAPRLSPPRPARSDQSRRPPIRRSRNALPIPIPCPDFSFNISPSCLYTPSKAHRPCVGQPNQTKPGEPAHAERKFAKRTQILLPPPRTPQSPVPTPQSPLPSTPSASAPLPMPESARKCPTGALVFIPVHSPPPLLTPSPCHLPPPSHHQPLNPPPSPRTLWPPSESTTMNLFQSLLNLPESQKRARGLLYTPAEIAQQPHTWRSAAAMLLQRRSEIADYLRDAGLMGPKRAILILTGAGSSEFVGNAAAPALSHQLGGSSSRSPRPIW